jgi:hypothetical protein
MAQCNPGELIAASFAFRDLDDRAMRMVIIQLLCDISASEGGGAPPPPPEPMMAPPPPGPDPDQMVMLQEQASKVEAQAETIAEQQQQIQTLANRLASIERVAGEHENRIAAVDGGVGSLHRSVISKADLTEIAKLRLQLQGIEKSQSDALENIHGRNRIFEESIRSLASREDPIIVESRLRGELSKVQDLIPKPVEQPVKKRWFERLRDFSTNLFS